MAARTTETVEASGHLIEVSNPAKLYFSDLGATKADLVAYYLAVAEALLRTAGGRPAMLERFPDGADGKSFFQKRVPAGAPAWLETTEVATPNGTRSNALVVADLAHVVWAVNLGCLGLHLWPYRAADPAHADELRIDLDPQPGVDFDEVRRAAHHTHTLLEELGLAGSLKTSGNRGLHVYVRLEPRWDSVAVRAGAVALARELSHRHPDLITAEWWKEERGRRVFIDFNQNAPHKTVFGAWFARPRPGGQVSTPIAWEDLDTVEPDALTIETVPARLAERGDPWAAVADAPLVPPAPARPGGPGPGRRPARRPVAARVPEGPRRAHPGGAVARPAAAGRRGQPVSGPPLPVPPPVSPMLAKLVRQLPEAPGLSYEPKWDGFRCIVFRRGDEIELGSRNERPLTRYFPELVDAPWPRTCRSAAWSTGRSSWPVRPASTSTPCPSGSTRRPPGCACWPRPPRPPSSPSTCWPTGTRTTGSPRTPPGGPGSSTCSRRRRPPST